MDVLREEHERAQHDAHTFHARADRLQARLARAEQEREEQAAALQQATRAAERAAERARTRGGRQARGGGGGGDSGSVGSASSEERPTYQASRHTDERQSRSRTPSPRPSVSASASASQVRRVKEELARARAEAVRLRGRLKDALCAVEGARIAQAAQGKADAQLRAHVRQLQGEVRQEGEAARGREARKDATIHSLRGRLEAARRQGKKQRDAAAERNEITVGAMMKQVAALQARLHAAEDDA